MSRCPAAHRMSHLGHAPIRTDKAEEAVAGLLAAAHVPDCELAAVVRPWQVAAQIGIDDR